MKKNINKSDKKSDKENLNEEQFLELLTSFFKLYGCTYLFKEELEKKLYEYCLDQKYIKLFKNLKIDYEKETISLDSSISNLCSKGKLYHEKFFPTLLITQIVILNNIKKSSNIIKTYPFEINVLMDDLVRSIILKKEKDKERYKVNLD